MLGFGGDTMGIHNSNLPTDPYSTTAPAQNLTDIIPVVGSISWMSPKATSAQDKVKIDTNQRTTLCAAYQLCLPQKQRNMTLRLSANWLTGLAFQIFSVFRRRITKRPCAIWSILFAENS